MKNGGSGGERTKSIDSKQMSRFQHHNNIPLEHDHTAYSKWIFSICQLIINATSNGGRQYAIGPESIPVPFSMLWADLSHKSGGKMSLLWQQTDDKVSTSQKHTPIIWPHCIQLSRSSSDAY